MLVYKVAVLNTIHNFFDYKADDLTPAIGCRVWVPFRNKTKLGIVVGFGNPENPNLKFKSILSLIDKNPIITDEILKLVNWVSNYYQAPLPAVFALVLPKKYRLGNEAILPSCDYFSLNVSVAEALESISNRLKKTRELVMFLAENKIPVAKKDLLAKGFSTLQLNKLINSNLVVKETLIEKQLINFSEKSNPKKLNSEQENALKVIAKNLDAYNCFLLKGVTGSGKTEVYLQVIAKVLAINRQVLILVPEIGLTPQLLARFSSRFTESMLVIHSNLNETERQKAWQLSFEGQVKIIIGTRSAVFTPMPNLGLIVIDEEHDLSLKQMDGVRYFARDTALMRAYTAKIPVILGSATPSLESIYNCKLKKYTLLQLNQKALDSPPLHYQLLDIRNKKLQDGLAKETITAIGEHLDLGNQVLVFINRRGFSPVLLCSECSFVADCNSCDTHLTLHRSINKLICHHCGLTRDKLNHCEKCNSHNLIPVGIGTQRIFERLELLFPTTSILRIDRDETTKKNAINKHLDSIHKGDAQLIIGTQMLAKGHHFPKLSLVVVLDADNGFYNQDFRALERLGQLLTQVSGRAGRAEIPGQVIIQTSLPQDPLLNILIQEGYESFANILLDSRQKSSLPPFSNLAILRSESTNLPRLLGFMQLVKKHLLTQGITVLGPAPAPLAKKSGQHRMQIMLKSSSRKKLNRALVLMRDFLMENKMSANIRWNIDVDPQDLA